MGVYLSLPQNAFAPRIRHFGFLHLENCIKFHWNEYTTEQQLFLTKSLMELLVVQVSTFFLSKKKKVVEKRNLFFNIEQHNRRGTHFC